MRTIRNYALSIVASAALVLGGCVTSPSSSVTGPQAVATSAVAPTDPIGALCAKYFENKTYDARLDKGTGTLFIEAVYRKCESAGFVRSNPQVKLTVDWNRTGSFSGRERLELYFEVAVGQLIWINPGDGKTKKAVLTLKSDGTFEQQWHFTDGSSESAVFRPRR
ncbi:MAG: hypothetical protein KIT25_03915 [Enhydrobacter sp.]|nr:MAG: hypothetical protein KIT25_03915 [Enhydrobacter sp.]